MKVKLDENMPSELAADLRARGHPADTVYDEGLAGASDTDLLEYVRREGRALWTMDRGIVDLRARRPEAYAGIVVFRPRSCGRGEVAEFVRRHLPALLTLDPAGRMIIVSEAGIRTR